MNVIIIDDVLQIYTTISGIKHRRKYLFTQKI